MDFSYSEKTRDLQAKLQRFMDENVYPNEGRFWAEIRGGPADGL